MASTEQPLTLGWMLKNFLLYGQRFLVYPAGFYPRPRNVRSTVSRLRHIEIQTSDNVLLRCFLFEPEQPDATILMFHGNAADLRVLRLRAIPFDYRRNLLMVSYRGFGDSEGVPSEKGLQRDAQAALDYVLRDSQLSSVPIILYGLSLGGAVAIDLTSKNPDKIKALIIENTFTSIPDIVRAWPIIGLLSFACTQRWNSASKISKIPPSVPILFCSGRDDTVVPPAHMDNLWKIAQARGRGVNRSGGLVRGIVRLGGWLFASGSGTLRVAGEEGEEGTDVWVPPQEDVFASYSDVGHSNAIYDLRYFSDIKQFLDKVVSL